MRFESRNSATPNRPVAKQPGTQVIWPIQYLRGIAALMVVWHHAREQLPGLQQIVAWNFGTSGVDLFFVISGFIMVVTTVGTGINPWQFWQRRIVRVVPLYWVLTLGLVAIWLVRPELFKTLTVTTLNLVQSLLFIPHFSSAFPDSVWPLLVPGWTLNFEMFFYAMFGLSLFLPSRGQLAGLSVIMLCLVVTGIAWAPFNSAVLSTYTSPLLLEFLAGAYLGYRYAQGQILLPTGVSVVLIGLGFAMLVLRDSPPLGVFVQIIGAILVVTGALNRHFINWHNTLLRRLGDSSYSLYLTHIFVLGVTRMAWGRIQAEPLDFANGLAYILVSTVVCVLVGGWVYAHIETPMTRSLQRLVSKRVSVNR